MAGARAGSCKEARMCCEGRDSTCVVQRAPLNSIIEDLDDKPCYCDTACLQIGDCCPDLKEFCKGMRSTVPFCYSKVIAFADLVALLV